MDKGTANEMVRILVLVKIPQLDFRPMKWPEY